jgi:hypothetical protein
MELKTEVKRLIRRALGRFGYEVVRKGHMEKTYSPLELSMMTALAFERRLKVVQVGATTGDK